MSLRPMAIVLAGIALVFPVFLPAADFNKQVDIGDDAPDFKGLEGVDGKRHGLDDYREANVVVVAFICNHCPVAQAYEDRFIRLAGDYKDRVAFVAINCNTIPQDRLDRMRERAREREFNFPYLYDPAQQVGRRYGATVTPHLFVLDEQRRIAYMGRFDDKQDAARAAKHYVRDAVDALLAGRRLDIEETFQTGCAIKYNSPDKTDE